MKWCPGQQVVVRSLGRKRGVIVEAGRGRYRIRMGSVVAWCREDDLEASDAVPRSRRAAAASRPESTPNDARRPPPPPRIDLHGLRVEEAMARVVDAIDRALVGGADRLEVVHGKGSGRIRDALHRSLASMRVVASFEPDPDNPGVTWVYF
jgi:DNA mismatch repair protein MutS2